MPSQKQGFEYDIFISYRQKDNKGERWVSEFVNSLRTELEATFKEDISIYFDENPHDGLLETHHVEHSLENKLRSLILIPVLSRTYCDPKSYAWTNEFLPFILKSQNDVIGPMVKLPNGNVSGRIIPIRIHDLAPADQSLFEEVSGGRMRSIDFVFRSQGVNRPLSSREDHPHDNLNKTYYRDQVNKVANAIHDVIQAIQTRSQKDQETAVTQTATPRTLGDVSQPKGKSASLNVVRKRWARIAAFAAIGLAALAVIGWIVARQSKIRWATDTALPRIAKIIEESNFNDRKEAYRLAVEAEQYIPDDPALDSLFAKCAVYINVRSEPAGARVFFKEYDNSSSAWTFIGQTPIDSLRMPIGTVLWKMEKQGYDTILAAATTWGLALGSTRWHIPYNLSRVLDKAGAIPPGMVRVTDLRDDGNMDDFYIDRFEVTNNQYKAFVDQGGYQDKKYWKNEFENKGTKLTWEQAMALFVDQTGRPGPANWEAGDYPDGQDNFPVSGISWYEAAAFAEFEGKTLPTSLHWNLARGYGSPLVQTQLEGVTSVVKKSNFGGKAAAPVGTFAGVNAFGTLDMAGNCREWCWNQHGTERVTRGGSFSDPIYTFGRIEPAPPMSRLNTIGFRCAKYPDPGKIPEMAFQPIVSKYLLPDFYNLKPVNNDVFDVYKEQFAYDKVELEPREEPQKSYSGDWTTIKTTLPAAYGGEYFDAFLFLPSNAKPPFQTVIYFPGSGAAYTQTTKGIEQSDEFNILISFLLKSGRAVLFPIYKGTYERGQGSVPPYHTGDDTRAFTEYLGQLVKDFRVCIDYLETRPDIDKERLAYVGLSWGAWMGSFVPAVEERLKTSILVAGGMIGNGRPEANEVNYISRVSIPTLMLNGKYDLGFPIETSVKPMFDLMATPAEHKRLVIYESSHVPPIKEVITESLTWLDRYLGPVGHK